jgi:hypothetical protein
MEKKLSDKNNLTSFIEALFTKIRKEIREKDPEFISRARVVSIVNDNARTHLNATARANEFYSNKQIEISRMNKICSPLSSSSCSSVMPEWSPRSSTDTSSQRRSLSYPVGSRDLSCFERQPSYNSTTTSLDLHTALHPPSVESNMVWRRAPSKNAKHSTKHPNLADVQTWTLGV